MLSNDYCSKYCTMFFGIYTVVTLDDILVGVFNKS